MRKPRASCWPRIQRGGEGIAMLARNGARLSSVPVPKGAVGWERVPSHYALPLAAQTCAITKAPEAGRGGIFRTRRARWQLPLRSLLQSLLPLSFEFFFSRTLFPPVGARSQCKLRSATRRMGDWGSAPLLSIVMPPTGHPGSIPCQRCERGHHS